MNEFKGTPGPWEAVDEVVYFGRDGGISLHEAPAPVDNARLIAAAPELFEALRACLPFADEEGFVNGVNIKAALLKALGEKL